MPFLIVTHSPCTHHHKNPFKSTLRYTCYFELLKLNLWSVKMLSFKQNNEFWWTLYIYFFSCQHNESPIEQLPCQTNELMYLKTSTDVKISTLGEKNGAREGGCRLQNEPSTKTDIGHFCTGTAFFGQIKLGWSSCRILLLMYMQLLVM